jgi:hypothetical protein
MLLRLDFQFMRANNFGTLLERTIGKAGDYRPAV